MAEWKQVAYRLEPEYAELLQSITDVTRRSGVDEFRLMLDARAITLGLEPVRPVDPKLSASPQELALA